MKKRTQAKKGEIARNILAAIGMAGLTYVAMGSPRGAHKIYRALWRRLTKKRFSGASINRSLNKLKARGVVALVKTRRGWRLELTDKGRAELLEYETCEKFLQKPKRWDQKWRLLVFDIEEKRRKVRDDIRRTLLGLGFFRLQDSVWVFPYECEEVLELLRTKHHVRHEALFVRADTITNDRWLRERFQLK